MINSATILVADDSIDDVDLLKRAIKKAGLSNPVCFLSDGDQVIEYLQRERNSASSSSQIPLLMFLDLNMPRRTGFAVLQWLRQQPQFQNLPTIVFTNSDDRMDIERSFELGAQGYWVKPARFEHLVQLMERLRDMLLHAAQKAGEDFLLPVAA